jgi:CRP/FNR family transcriptional regulator, cyclic AMP receptor protein
MALQDLAGCIAAILVFATFSAKRMVPLRTLGVASNIAFVAYASMAGLWPIFFHSVLLPMNALRLGQAIFCPSLTL